MARTIPEVKSNIKKLVEKGAGLEDVKAYVKAEGYTPEQLRYYQAPQTQPQNADEAQQEKSLLADVGDRAKSFAMNFAQGFTANTLDEAIAKAIHLIDKDIPEDIALQSTREVLAKSKKENPVNAFVGELGGAITSPINKIIPGAGSGATLGQQVAGLGAVSAIQGFGAGEGGFTNRAKSGLISGAIGAGTGYALGKAGEKISQMAKGREIYPQATTGQAIALGGGKEKNIPRLVEKTLGQSIYGQPIRNQEATATKFIANQLDDLAREGTDDLAQVGAQAKEGAQKAIENASSRFGELYNTNVWERLPNKQLTPAVYDNTAQFIEESSASLTKAQRDWLNQNVISELADPQGLNISRLQALKQQIGLRLGDLSTPKVFGRNDKVINGLYGALKKDLYATVRNSGDDTIVKSLMVADKEFSKFANDIQPVLDRLANATPTEYSRVANELIRKTTNKGGDFNSLQKLFEYLPPEDADILRQNLVKNITKGTTTGFAKTVSEMPARSKQLIFGDYLPQVEKMVKLAGTLKTAPLNTSGTAMAGLDLLKTGELTGLGASVYNPNLLAYPASIYAGSQALVNAPKVLTGAQKGFNAIGLDPVKAGILMQAIKNYNTNKGE